jgi:hypothetical protein
MDTYNTSYATKLNLNLENGNRMNIAPLSTAAAPKTDPVIHDDLPSANAKNHEIITKIITKKPNKIANNHP